MLGKGKKRLSLHTAYEQYGPSGRSLSQFQWREAIRIPTPHWMGC